MDNVIVDVVLGLVLIYLVLALLVTKLQEYLLGDLFRRRVGNLHDLVQWAVGNDDALHARVMANPLISALYESNAARRGMLPRGPSAIPPDLFARALLMELHDGTPPSSSFPTPEAFMQTHERESATIWKALRGLLPGAEGQWSAFETAIAAWFTDVGDRAKGWFQRESQRWTLLLALAVAAGLNVDSTFVAERLANDPSLRRSLASIAERVNQLFGPDAQPQAGGGNAAVAPAPARRPALRAAEQIATANANLAEAFNGDDAVAAFGFSRYPVKQKCKGVAEHADANEQAARELKSGSLLNNKYLSNADTWLNVLPALRAVVGGGGEDTTALKDAHTCLNHLAAWVGSATTASKRPDTRKLMADAALALDQARASVLEMLETEANPVGLRQLFLRDPDSFRGCADLPGTTRAEVERCLLRSQSARVSLPIGFTGENRRLLACRVARKGDAIDTGPFGWCNEAYEGHSALGIAKIELTARDSLGGILAVWLAGVSVTGLFVALGAPFWFDVLSKVTRLRSAGRMLDEPQRQTLPAPLDGTGGSASSSTGRSGGDGTDGGTLAVNDFERSLLPREIVAIQQRLGVVPASGVLDAATRERLRRSPLNGTGTDELGLTLYEQITGRAPSAVPELRESDRPQRGVPHRLAGPLADKLTRLLGFDKRLSGPQTVFGDELRAMTVLYRCKIDPAMPERLRRVYALAKDKPAALDEVSDALADEILRRPDSASLPRDAVAPWLDWAIGELGQVERNRSTRSDSDPRIIEYLDSLAPPLGDHGDTTAWCGAFVAWVVQRHNALAAQTGARGLAAPPAGAALALEWRNWGKARNGAVLTRGDVIVVVTDRAAGKFHVGFCLETDATHVWLLGGNQASGSRVCLSPFPLGDVMHVRFG